ncbi:MAG: hypothetical protein HPY83_19175 [Anaerolineae bacterium]|nr:hypothetical protein [Anaerolineae bacterium]
MTAALRRFVLRQAPSWAACCPLALRRLHRFSWGLALLFVGVLMGVQIGRIFLTGEWYGVPVR